MEMCEETCLQISLSIIFKKLIVASPSQVDEIMVSFVQITVNGKIASSHGDSSWRTVVEGVDSVFFIGSS